MSNDNPIEQVAKRLRGLRDALEISVSEISGACGVEESTYMEYESGDRDIPVSFLHRLSREYGVELTALLFGEEPKMTGYFVTRKGTGMSVARRAAYNYESLAGSFANRVMDPFIVTVEPNQVKEPVCNTHQGQEFNYILEGSMEITVGNNRIILNEGDTIMFDAMRPHKMKALNNARVRFIAIIA